MYRRARSEKVISMTILGARVVLVLRAQAAYPGPANTHSPQPTRYPTISRGSSKPSRPEPLRTKLAPTRVREGWTLDEATVARFAGVDRYTPADE